MTDKQVMVIASVLGNCFLFGMFGYAVFVLGANPWWFALPILIHFTLKDWKDDDE